MSRIIEREACRRQTLPTLIHSLTAMGPLYKVLDFGDHVAIVLLNRGNPLTLKFSDEDAAADEGYTLQGSSRTGEVKLCKNFQCARGCGCDCVRDRGYVREDNSLFCMARVGCPGNCESRVLENYPPDPPFTLRCTKIMIHQLLETYIESALSALSQG